MRRYGILKSNILIYIAIWSENIKCQNLLRCQIFKAQFVFRCKLMPQGGPKSWYIILKDFIKVQKIQNV